MPLTDEKRNNRYAFTPGPWVAREGLVIAPEFGWKGELVAKPMAQALDNLDHSTLRAEANARLIAAAPAMLAALKSGHEVLCELLEGRAHLGLHKDDRAMMRAALKDIRAAIALAKGGAA